MCRRPLHSAQAWKKTPILRSTLSQKLAGDVATSLVPFILVPDDPQVTSLQRVVGASLLKREKGTTFLTVSCTLPLIISRV